MDSPYLSKMNWIRIYFIRTSRINVKEGIQDITLIKFIRISALELIYNFCTTSQI